MDDRRNSGSPCRVRGGCRRSQNGLHRFDDSRSATRAAAGEAASSAQHQGNSNDVASSSRCRLATVPRFGRDRLPSAVSIGRTAFDPKVRNIPSSVNPSGQLLDFPSEVWTGSSDDSSSELGIIPPNPGMGSQRWLSQRTSVVFTDAVSGEPNRSLGVVVLVGRGSGSTRGRVFESSVLRVAIGK